MAKFVFRLQKVLDFRASVEEAAKNAYLDARAQRIEAEALIVQIEDRRQAMLAIPTTTVEQLRSMEMLMQCMDDEVHQQNTVIAVLQTEEEKLREEWVLRKQELEALVKLRDKAQDEWHLDQTRKEQAELDEWSSMRRTG